MRRTTVIVVVVIVVVMIAAVAGAFLMTNPGTNPPEDQQGGGATDIRPSGPEGSVSSAVVNTGGTNDSNASALPELEREYHATPNSTGSPDAFCKVAVTNNRTDEIDLRCHNFTARLENGSTIQALNINVVVVASNTTVYIVLGFVTKGVNITSISYSDERVTFNVAWTKTVVRAMQAPVVRTPPNVGLTVDANLSFSSLDAWRVERGGYSPMSLQFDNRSVVLCLVVVTNSNTTAVSLKASDFWLDLGNGSWAQGEDRLNNNVPRSVAANTTVPFLLGFRGASNANPAAIYYWPGAGSLGERIAIQLNQTPTQGPFVVLKKIWDRNATAGASGNNTSAPRPVMVQLLLVGDGASGADLSGVRAWTLRSGQLSGTAVEEGDPGANGSQGRVVTLTFNVRQGDDLTLLTFESGGVTKYVWLRPLQPAP